MKNVITRLACVLLGLILLAGCASSSDSGKTSNSGGVALLFGQPTKAYSEVGTVSTPKIQPSGISWQTALQRQAAALGADAVIIDSSTLDSNTSNMVSGKAIRYQ